MPKVVAIYAMNFSESVEAGAASRPTNGGKESYIQNWIVATESLSTSYKTWGLGVKGGTTAADKPQCKKSSDGKTITWYQGKAAAYQYNDTVKYYYFAFG